MAKHKLPELGENCILVRNSGPIDEAIFRFKHGRVTLITGDNGAGKSEALKCINALCGGGTDGLSLRDGAEDGLILGFGCQIKLTAKMCRRTGELEILFTEEGFSLANFVKPGLKDPVANDKRRLKDLASVLEVKIDKAAVYELVGGKQTYLDIVTDKTTDAKDPAAYVSALKMDCDKAALEWEREAEVFSAEARTLEDTLPAMTANVESDAEVLSARMANAINAKTALENRKTAAAEMQRLAGLAKDLLESGQGQTVEAARLKHDEAEKALKAARDKVQALETELAIAKTAVEDRTQDAINADLALDDAEYRSDKIEEANEQLTKQSTPPSSAEFESADQAIKTAEDAMILGNNIRKAMDVRKQVSDKKAEASSRKTEAEKLRAAAKSCTSLLVAPINKLACGIEVDENMRLVVTEHKRGRVPFEELSDGEKVSLAVRLVTKVVGGSDVPGIIVLEQTWFESLDATNRQALVDAVAETNLMFVVAEATRNGSEPHVGSRILGEEE